MEGLPLTLKSGRSIYLAIDHDLAGLVGNIPKKDFAFIDLGNVLEPSGTVPVSIKSLVFQF
jgi:ethanolamine utilization protein EutA